MFRQHFEEMQQVANESVFRIEDVLENSIYALNPAEEKEKHILSCAARGRGARTRRPSRARPHLRGGTWRGSDLKMVPFFNSSPFLTFQQLQLFQACWPI